MKNTMIEEYDLEQLLNDIRATITTLQAYINNDFIEPDSDTIYFQLESIRLHVDLIEAITSEPIEDRITTGEIMRLGKALNLTGEQMEAFLKGTENAPAARQR